MKAPTADEILDCKHHHQTLLCGGNTIGYTPDQRYSVRLCRDCGRFFVFVWLDGLHTKITFELVRDEDLESAGKFIEMLREEEKHEG